MRAAERGDYTRRARVTSDDEIGHLMRGFNGNRLSPLVGVGTINQGISIGSIVVSLIGAIILLAIVNLFRRGRVR